MIERSLHSREMSMRARRSAAALIALVALVGTACTGSGSGASDDTDPTPSAAGTEATQAASVPNEELTIGLTFGPQSLDPAKDGYEAHVGTFRALTFESITRLREDGSVGPGLATEFGYVGDDYQTFEFTLRQDAVFSDGEPVDAEAVKTWLEYFPTAGGQYANSLALDSVEAVDDWTVRINLAETNRDVPFLLSGGGQNWGWVASPEAVATPEALSRQTFGAGPYTLDPAESVEGDHYTLVPNEHYYDQSKIRWAQVNIRIIPDQSSLLQAAQAGQVDIAQGDLTTAAAAEDAGLTVADAPKELTGLMLMDRSGALVPALGDVRVRQALNYAVNREEIVSTILAGRGEATSMWGFAAGIGSDFEDYYGYDPEKAKTLLAEAGHADGFAMPVLSTAAVRGGANASSFQAVARDLQAVGVELDVTEIATAAEYQEKLASGDYAALWDNWGLTSQRTYDLLLAPEAPQSNNLGWSDPALDELMGEAVNAPADRRAQLLQDAAEHTVTEAHFVPVATFPYLLYHNDRVDGVSLNVWSFFRPIATEWFPAQ